MKEKQLEVLMKILSESQWDISDTTEHLEARLNNIRDYCFDLLPDCTCFDDENTKAPDEDKPINCPIHGVIL